MRIYFVIGNHDKDGNYIKEEEKFCKQVQGVIKTVQFQAGKLVKNIFFLSANDIRRSDVYGLQASFFL